MQDGSCARLLWCELVSYGLSRAELPAQYWVVKHACTGCRYHAILFEPRHVVAQMLPTVIVAVG
jgi:hypothetical protein